MLTVSLVRHSRKCRTYQESIQTSGHPKVLAEIATWNQIQGVPKEITHIHVAEKIRERMQEPVKSLLTRQDRPYSFGSMSPDLYYYDIRLPLEKKHNLELGEIIHGRYGNDNSMHVLWMLERCVEIKEKNPDSLEPMFAFLCGYLTHVAADIVFHPYVYSVSGNYYDPDPKERSTAEGRHRLFETLLDFHILNLRNQSLQDFQLLERINPGKHKDNLLGFFSKGMSNASSVKLPTMPEAEDIHWITERSFRRSRTMIGLFHNRPLVAGLNSLNWKMQGKISHIAYLGYVRKHRASDLLQFSSLEPTPHPVTGQDYGGPVPGLIEESTELGKDYLDVCWRRISGEASAETARKVLRPLSLNNGLEKTPTEKMVHYKIHPALNVV